MNRLLVAASLSLSIAFYVAGCSGKPCQTSNDCGAQEQCVSAHCAALSCSSTWFAVDPSSGQCRPLPGCGNRDDVRGWATCSDPCSGLGEFACIGDPRCQPAYSTTDTGPVPLCAGAGVNGGPLPSPPASSTASVPTCGGTPTRTFDGCRPNPLLVDPCAGLDQSACALDPRCAFQPFAGVGGCDCPAGGVCNCPNIPAQPPVCRVKTCNDYVDAATCAQHPECTADPNFGIPTTPPAPVPNAVDGGAPLPFQGCFPQGGGSCSGYDEQNCLAHPECHPVGTPCYCPALTDDCKCSGGAFTSCEPDDGLHRCSADSDCGSDERCANDDNQCAPPVGAQPVAFPAGAGAGASPLDKSFTPCGTGLCMPKGCKGYGEQRCNADPTCEASYVLECSPYGFGGGEDFGCGGAPPSPNAGVAACGPCEPSFVGCNDAGVVGPIDPERSVLVREPTVVDDPAFAFPTVMSALAGTSDASPFVERWWAQLGADVTIDGRTAASRAPAAAFIAQLPRRADGHLDLAQVGFQVTSLSNRIDLAGPNNCGEARITYALAGGLSDRRHRMTIIVELGQPDDGAQCRTVAQRWVALSKLSGADLVAALKAIYAPLLTPAHLNQVRTNEFLVGPDTGTPPTPATAWELREWHLGADGDLHLALSRQAVDATAATTDAFLAWAQTNQAAISAGVAQVPADFLAVTSSENGSRISVLGLPDVEVALNKTACAGCHTTETNSAFAHVAERFQGGGRAVISDFLRQQLPLRARNLSRVAAGQLAGAARATALFIVH
jgi:hypothetical protein